MRTCPNSRCRLVHDDSVGMCPECGAPMGRTPDLAHDPNMALYAQRDVAMREAALERRLSSRRSRGAGAEFDTGAPAPVLEDAREIGDAILGLYGIGAE